MLLIAFPMRSLASPAGVLGPARLSPRGLRSAARSCQAVEERSDEDDETRHRRQNDEAENDDALLAPSPARGSLERDRRKYRRRLVEKRCERRNGRRRSLAA